MNVALLDERIKGMLQALIDTKTVLRYIESVLILEIRDVMSNRRINIFQT